MNSAPLTIKAHGNAIMLSESIELMALSLREEFLDQGALVNDKTAEHALYAGLNMIAFAAKNLGDYVEQCQNELERATQKSKGDAQ